MWTLAVVVTDVLAKRLTERSLAEEDRGYWTSREIQEPPLGMQRHKATRQLLSSSTGSLGRYK